MNHTLDIPVLPAERFGDHGLQVWCPHCRRHHQHGTGGGPEPGDGRYGHHVAHCRVEPAPFPHGYYLVDAARLGSVKARP